VSQNLIKTYPSGRYRQARPFINPDKRADLSPPASAEFSAKAKPNMWAVLFKWVVKK